MRLSHCLLSLPAPLLLLIANFQQSVGAVDERQSPSQWPYNLPAHVKYWPEDSPYRRRDLEAFEQHILAGKTPIGVKKMGVDEGEKFFVEYWNFGDASPDFEDGFSRSQLNPFEDEGSLHRNDSILPSFQHPFALHQSDHLDLRQAFYARRAFDALLGRNSFAFTCPSGTLSCTNINQPNSCCTTDQTCFTITDTGLGDVGCCPNGETCTGVDISCPANYASCPDNTGGGCCIPGYICAGPGCVPSQSVVTVITTITVTPSTGSAVVILTSTSVKSDPLTSLSATAIATDTGLQTTLTCSASYRACPVSQGGGCCLSDRECGVTDCPTSPGSPSSTDTLTFTTATGTAIVPVRPTSSNTITVFKSTGTGTAVATGSTCPIGFYGCSAVHQGGCCRTGRNCDTTDCPATEQTTIVSGDETIVVPVGTGGSLAATTTFGSGLCPTGWFNCGSVLGGGCCPTGYDCGLASCSLFSGTATVLVGPKDTTSGVGRSRRIGMKGWLGGVVGVCWVGGLVMILTMMWF